MTQENNTPAEGETSSDAAAVEPKAKAPLPDRAAASDRSAPELNVQARTGTSQRPAAPEAPNAVPRSSSAGLWLAVLDLLAILAVAGAGYLAIQNFEHQRFSQQQRVDALAQTVNGLDVAKQGREQWFADADSRIREAANLLSELQRKQAALSEHQTQTDHSLAQLSVQVQGGQNAWQRAEVEHLLLVANTRLLLQRDIEGAQIALRLANERLASLANPAYFRVREQISRELTQLEAVPQIDLQALALQLSSLTDQVDALAVRMPKVGRFDTELRFSGAPEESVWYRKLWVSIEEAVTSLVSVRRDADRREPLLPPDQSVYLQQNLRLQLESARLAALKLDPANFTAALRQAESWLQRYFDTQQAATSAALQSIQRLQSTPLKPALPDISGSLSSLRATETGT